MSEQISEDEIVQSVTIEPIDIKSRQREAQPQGIDVVLNDGQTWVLPYLGLARGLTEIRDRMFDQLCIKDSVDVGDILDAASFCLSVNYELSREELASLLIPTGRDETEKMVINPDLVDAVIDAVLPMVDDSGMTFTKWARGSLLSCGIKPADVPARDLPGLLAILQANGRIKPIHEYDSAAAYAVQKRRVLALRKPTPAMAQAATPE